MADVTEIMQMCRLCLVKEQVNIPIFEEPGDVHEVLLKISACLPVKVSREDNLPKKVCDGCGYKLDLLYQFWNTASNAEKQLVQWLTAAGVDPKHNSTAEDILAAVQPKVVLKQEPNADDSLSLDTQSYILQQQQIPVYQQKDEFKEYTPTTTTTTTTTVPTPAKKKATASPAAKAPASKRPKRATRSKRAVKDSSEDEDDLPLAKAAITKTEQVAIESDDDDGDMGDMGDPDFGTGDDEDNDTDQPGPSGVGKSSNDAPLAYGRNNRYMVKDAKYGKIAFAKGDDFFCYLCNEPTKMNGLELKKHFIDEHPDEIVRYIKLDQFEKMSPVCEICSETFPSLKILKEHMTQHPDQYQCDKCEKSFKSILDYSIHKYQHSKVYACELCDATSKSACQLRTHYGKHLDSCRHYVCEFCSQRFEYPSVRKEHLKIHRAVKDVQCEFCAKTFISMTRLRDHVDYNHPEEGTQLPGDFACQECGLTFKWKRVLARHVANVHNRRRFICVCEVCGKNFNSQQAMRRHTLHHGEKNFECPVCLKKFMDPRRLSEHERIHTGQKPYPCRICGKRFTQCGSRKIHERTHTNEKPYICRLCCKGFNCAGSMNTHMKTCSGS